MSVTSSASGNSRSASRLGERAERAFRLGLGRESVVGIAVSGGSDSMALLVLAAEAAAKAGVTVKAATVDHGLRPEAAEEARIVRDFCKRLDVDHVTLRWKRDAEDPISQGSASRGSVSQGSVSQGSVSQDRARRARHRLLAEWAETTGAGVVALGHTRDDRLETFLMRVRQGSGWHGLAGLLPTGFSPVWPEGRGLKVIRPLLAFGREELREELRARGVVWIEDPSNEAAKFERVRMRKLLQRMDPGTQARALKVMDGLMEMRRSVAADAQRLLKQVKTANGVASVPLAAREAAGAQAWLRFVEAMVMAAGGAAGPPRREALDRLLVRIAAREPALERGVTLAGAAIRLRKGALAFSQAPPRRDEAPRPGPDWDRAGQLLTMPDLRMLAV